MQEMMDAMETCTINSVKLGHALCRFLRSTPEFHDYVQGMMEAMEKTYNDSQLTAVTAGLSGDPVVLIQVSTLLFFTQPCQPCRGTSAAMPHLSS